MGRSSNLTERDGRWYIIWTFRGQRHSVSTGVPVGETAEARRVNLGLAREARDRYQAEKRGAAGREPEGLWRSLLEALGRLPEETQRRLRAEWGRELLHGATAPVQLGEAWDLWLASPLRGQAGAVTLSQYRSAWDRFRAWAAGRGIMTMGEVGPESAVEYGAGLIEEQYSEGSFNAHVRFLRLVWSGLRHRVDRNPWRDVPLRKLARLGRRNLTRDELLAVVRAADGELRVAVAVGFYTGLRLGDVCRLRWSEVDLVEGWVSVVPHKTARTSGASVRVPIHAALREILEAWAERTERVLRGELVLPDLAAEYRRDRSGPAVRVGELLRSAGIETTEEIPEGVRRIRRVARVGFHSLRHSLASLAQADGPGAVAVVQELLGHGSPAMTLLYSHGDDAARRRVIDSLPAVG
jgi:integrase